MPLEGLCSPTEAWLFYYGWSRVYDVMQPYFTSPEMREAGLDPVSYTHLTLPTKA